MDTIWHLNAQAYFAAISCALVLVGEVAIPERPTLILFEVETIDRDLCVHSIVVEEPILPDDLVL